MATGSNLLTEALERSHHDRILLEIYSRDSDSDRFAVGWIVTLSDSFYIAATVDKQGRADGFQAGNVDDLLMVASRGEYLDAISKAMMDHLDEWPKPIEATSMKELLERVKDAKEVVTLMHSNGLRYEGIVVAFDETHIGLDVYGRVGEYEGRYIFAREDVGRATFGGPDQRKVALLMRRATE
ncbi:MAG: hypothetical protein ACAH95_10300 [Fimbriimonas sp.]